MSREGESNPWASPRGEVELPEQTIESRVQKVAQEFADSWIKQGKGLAEFQEARARNFRIGKRGEDEHFIPGVNIERGYNPAYLGLLPILKEAVNQENQGSWLSRLKKEKKESFDIDALAAKYKERMLDATEAILRERESGQ